MAIFTPPSDSKIPRRNELQAYASTPLDARLASIDGALRDLDESLHRLFDGIDPVLRPLDEDGEDPIHRSVTTFGEQQSHSQLSGYLQSLIARITALDRKVLAVTNRIDL